MQIQQQQLARDLALARNLSLFEFCFDFHTHTQENSEIDSVREGQRERESGIEYKRETTELISVLDLFCCCCFL